MENIETILKNGELKIKKLKCEVIRKVLKVLYVELKKKKENSFFELE